MTGGYRKIKLFSLVVALMMAGLAVVGGTWATGALYDGEASDVPQGTSYAVELKYYDGGNGYVSTAGNDVNYFGNDPWCPGKTQIVYLKVENNEDFAVNATVRLNVGQSTLDDGVMEYAFYTADQSLHDDSSKPSNWNEFKTRAGAGVGVLKENQSYEMIHQVGLDAAKNAEYIALAIHMKESASNSNQNKSMSLGFSMQIDSLFAPNGEL